MTNSHIEDLGMLDIEYAQLVSKGYEPILERQLIACGEDPDTARSLTRFAGMLQDKPPETDEEWEELLSAWEDVCGLEPNFELPALCSDYVSNPLEKK